MWKGKVNDVQKINHNMAPEFLHKIGLASSRETYTLESVGARRRDDAVNSAGSELGQDLFWILEKSSRFLACLFSFHCSLHAAGEPGNVSDKIFLFFLQSI